MHPEIGISFAVGIGHAGAALAADGREIRAAIEDATDATSGWRLLLPLSRCLYLKESALIIFDVSHINIGPLGG